jgi:DNA-directed RNA polymerase specialized sigma24 family protein
VKPLTNVPVPPGAATDPADQVTALYQAHALGLLRLAVIMLGEQQAAEDVVQDAFQRRCHQLHLAQAAHPGASGPRAAPGDSTVA